MDADLKLLLEAAADRAEEVGDWRAPFLRQIPDALPYTTVDARKHGWGLLVSAQTRLNLQPQNADERIDSKDLADPQMALDLYKLAVRTALYGVGIRDEEYIRAMQERKPFAASKTISLQDFFQGLSNIKHEDRVLSFTHRGERESQ